MKREFAVTLLSDNPVWIEMGRLLAMDIAVSITTPSPYFDHAPDVWQAHQRLCNARLKLFLQLKRKYQQPIKSLPLP